MFGPTNARALVLRAAEDYAFAAKWRAKRPMG